MPHPDQHRVRPKYRYFFKNECSDSFQPVDPSSVLDCVDGFVAVLPAPPDAEVGDQIQISGYGPDYLNGVQTVTQIQGGYILTDLPCDEDLAITTPGTIKLGEEQARVPCYPEEFLNAKYGWEREKDQIFYRKQLKGQLFFINDASQNISDWTFLKDIYDNYKCCEIKFIVEKWCDGEWITDWEGYFAHNDGKWDFSKCVVSFEFFPEDKYTCVLNNSNEEVNILELTAHESFSTLDPLEGEIYIDNDITCVFASPPSGSDWQVVLTDCSIGQQIWWRPTYLSLFSPDCSIGGGPPINAVYNWSYETGDCTTGGALYTSPYVLASIVVQQCSDPPPVPVGSVGFVLIYQDCVNDISIYAPVSLPDTFDRGRKLNEAIEYVITQTCPELAGVISNFFEINPVDDNPEFPYTPLKNYVIEYTNILFSESYDDDNKWNNILIHHRSEAMLNPPSTPATIGTLTFEDLMLMLRTLFNVYWRIDSNNNLRLEHIIFFDKTLLYDLTVGDAKEWNRGKNQLSFTKEKMPRIERFETIEYTDYNFRPKDIIYRGPCTLQTLEEKITYTPGEFLLDYEVIIFGSNANTDGWVLQACRPTTNIMYRSQAYFTFSDVFNAPLSWANLLIFFLRFERVLLEGYMLGFNYEMRTRIRSKKQVGINMIDCCYNDTFDPETGYVKTDVGIGEIEIATFHIDENCFEFSLLFPD